MTGLSAGLFLDAVAEEPLRIDRVEPQSVLEFLAQLADVALDDVLVDVLVEEPIDGIEDLGLADPPATAAQQKFEDSPLPAGQGKGPSVRLGLAAVKIDAQFADPHMSLLAEHAPVDRSDPGHDFAHMDRLAQDIVRAGGEQAQCIVERVTLVEAKNGRVRALAN